MSAGKTTVLLQTAYNYEERGQKVFIIKPAVDTKGGDRIVSRIGLERKVDLLLKPKDNILEKVADHLKNINCFLVDEAQFLTKCQVDECLYIAKHYDIPVIAFGLRTNFKMEGFEGSMRLLLLADSLEEMPTICSCGKKARFSARQIKGRFQTEGENIVIDLSKDVKYESLCGKCYLEKIKKVKNEKK